MNKEIKEILDRLERIEHKEYTTAFEFADSSTFNEMARCFEERKKLADYITNLKQKCENQRLELVSLNDRLKEVKKSNGYLKQENEDLREDNYAYHQLMKIQNKREYRSKFLKEFQEEYGTNVFPDYDEIYKRYDKMKKENERLKDELKRLHNLLNSQAYQDLDNYKLKNEILKEELQQEKKDFKETNDYCFKLISYKSRIDKAIEYINKVKILNEEYKEDWTFKVFVPSLENILKGGDEE